MDYPTVAARNLYSAICGVKKICATESLVKGIRLDVCYHRIHDFAPDEQIVGKLRYMITVDN